MVLGEFIVQGKVIPDEFIVFKPSLRMGKNPIIAKKYLGKKNIKLVYAKNGTKEEKVS
jgi:pyruvate,water dikinase